MEMRTIGSLEVSAVGLGTNNFGIGRMEPQDVPPVVDAALEAGINFFDTADGYGNSEELLGKALVGRRDAAVIATKFASPVDGGPGGASPDYVRTAVERSLKELGTDRIDLYQIHRPDQSTPIADTLGALDELVKAGKVLEIGCSNFSGAQLREAQAAIAPGGARFVSVQNELSLVRRNDEANGLPVAAELDIAYLPYFPLASGVLTGKYRRGEAPPAGSRLGAQPAEVSARALSDKRFDTVEALTAWAEAHGHSILDLAFAWLLAKPVVASVIAGATKVDQVEANAAAGGWTLTPAEVAEVDAISARPA
jgi:aryl-alcohol dehydrogenase-like predicted oxidoreductase